MDYIRRIVDDVIDQRTEAFNAVSITGPKGCGKTRTAERAVVKLLSNFRMKIKEKVTLLWQKQHQNYS